MVLRAVNDIGSAADPNEALGLRGWLYPRGDTGAVRGADSAAGGLS